ncbi:hypothetical protein HPB50_028833 [Hyalomma asiaticum]|nr:hypothetical protein HPB50_028833 [Hyalomma asiaticum]
MERFLSDTTIVALMLQRAKDSVPEAPVLPLTLPQDDLNEAANRLPHKCQEKMWFGSIHLRRLCNRLRPELKERVLATYDISDRPRANANEDEQKT